MLKPRWSSVLLESGCVSHPALYLMSNFLISSSLIERLSAIFSHNIAFYYYYFFFHNRKQFLITITMLVIKMNIEACFLLNSDITAGGHNLSVYPRFWMDESLKEDQKVWIYKYTPSKLEAKIYLLKFD